MRTTSLCAVLCIWFLPSHANADEGVDRALTAATKLRAAAEHYEANGRNDASAVDDALDEMAAALRESIESIDDNVLDDLMPTLTALSRTAPYDVRVRVWAVAAAVCRKSGRAILDAALAGPIDDARLVTGLSEACRASRCGGAHVWLAANAPRLWPRATSEPARGALVEALRSSIACIGGCDVTDDPKRAGRAVESAVRKVLAKAPEALEREIVVALALVPCKASRVMLGKWRKKKKDRVADATLVAMLHALGTAGDADAVPLMLDHMPETAPAVLEEAIVALHALPAAILKARGKRILGATIELSDEEGRASRSLTAKAKRNKKEEARLALYTARYDAWQTRRILDEPPKPLPDGATGWPGILALWWRILDAGPKGVTPPSAPPGAAIKFMNNRPNVVGSQWTDWWRSTR